MAKTLRPWDQYVTDAQREPLELPIGPDGNGNPQTLTITMPSGGTIRRINRAQRVGDDETTIRELFGSSADKVLELSDEAPAGALMTLVQEVLGEFGLTAPGNPLTSSS